MGIMVPVGFVGDQYGFTGGGAIAGPNVIGTLRSWLIGITVPVGFVGDQY